MSFASVMKDELCAGSRDKACCNFAELAGMILSTAVFEQDMLRLYTEHEHVANRFAALLYEVFDAGCEIVQRSGGTMYKIWVSGQEPIGRMRREILYHAPEQRLPKFRTHPALFKKDCCIRSFLKGVFLSAGFIADPNKQYHFELVTRHGGLCDDILQLFLKFGITAKKTTRKSHFVVYLKESEAIADAIAVIGAKRALMEFRNIQVLKDVRNQVNRSVNCETANVAKTAGAAAQQVKNIRLIEKKMGLSNLPDDLQELARLRLEHPEATLVEIGRLLSVSLTKSGVNHRFRKIEKIARELEK